RLLLLALGPIEGLLGGLRSLLRLLLLSSGAHVVGRSLSRGSGFGCTTCHDVVEIERRVTCRFEVAQEPAGGDGDGGIRVEERRRDRPVHCLQRRVGDSLATRRSKECRLSGELRGESPSIATEFRQCR